MGFAVAKALIARGDTVFIGGRDARKLEAALDRLGPAARGAVVDARDRTALQRFFPAAGPIAGLFTPGASYRPAPFRTGEEETVRDLFDGKFWGQYWAAHAALPHLTNSAAIVFVSGTASVRPLGSPAYAACNAALEGLTRALARELSPVRVNCLSPGLVDSELWRDRPAEVRDPAIDSWNRLAITGRPGSVQEAAQAVLFLLDNGNYCDGGYVLR
jgi:NAD(P)-dependent dehydrogenase (short-subunit alcohol dehydrogenase family)